MRHTPSVAWRFYRNTLSFWFCGRRNAEGSLGYVEAILETNGSSCRVSIIVCARAVCVVYLVPDMVWYDMVWYGG